MSDLGDTKIIGEDGCTYIASSRRPDGTWRKPIKVKAGYVPQDEVPVYESRGRQFTQDQPTYPVGLNPSLIADAKNKQKNKEKPSNFAGNRGNVSKGSTEGALVKRGRGHKSASASTFTDRPTINSTAPPAGSQSEPACSDPALAKKLRTVQRKLRDIEILEQKIESGELKSPEKNQMEKILKKGELAEELDLVQAQIASLTVN